jgi:hypothetical protein
LIAALIVVYATAWGPWAFSDAVGYVTAARNVVAGYGIGAFDPSGHFSPGVSHPPLYVLALVAVSLAGFEPVQSARILDVLLFGMLVAVSGLLFSRVLGSRWPGVALSAMLLVHPGLLIAYTSAMAEPPFLLLGLASLLLLAKFLGETRAGPYWGSALCAGGALLSRYPGAAFVLTGAAALMLQRGQPLAVRLRRAGGFVAIGVLPIVFFLIGSATAPGVEGPRGLKVDLQLLPALGLFVRQAVAAVWTWKPLPPAVLLPDWVARVSPLGSIVAPLGVLVLLTFIWLAARVLRRIRAEPNLRALILPEASLLGLLALFVGTYLGFFVAAYLVTDPTPDVDSRTLLPLLPASLGIVLVLCHASLKILNESRALRLGWGTLLSLTLLGYAVISQDIVLGLRRTGLGYTGRDWRQSETIAAVNDLPGSTPLITNEPAAVLLLTGRTAYQIQEIAERRRVETFEGFGEGATPAEAAFRERHGALVLFDTIYGQLGSIYGEAAEARFQTLVASLKPVFVGQDGTIYTYPSE